MSLRASTSRGYAAHVRGYLVPYLGGIPLAELSPGDVQAMFTAIIRDGAVPRHAVSAATLHRIHATLRAAQNAAVLAGPISVNPGRWPERPATGARWAQTGYVFTTLTGKPAGPDRMTRRSASRCSATPAS